MHFHSNLFLKLGPPASGKGTQSKIISKKYGMIHISVGDMLRSEMAADTELGRLIKEHMDGGKLVPDSLVCSTVTNRLLREDCMKHGWILDGFPRTAAQVDILRSSEMSPHLFIILEVSDKSILERMNGRLLDPLTGEIYHSIHRPPPNNMLIKQRLQHRADDSIHTGHGRLRDYRNRISDIAESYQHILETINGESDYSIISRHIDIIIQKRFGILHKDTVINKENVTEPLV
jgi:adenylate kinase